MAKSLNGKELYFIRRGETRRKAARWALDHLDKLGSRTPRVPGALHDRAQEIAPGLAFKFTSALPTFKRIPAIGVLTRLQLGYFPQLHLRF
jgi:hypothetical protein